MISSEHSLHHHSRQYKWLVNDLKNVDRSVTPWVIIECHRPLYQSQFLPPEYVTQVFMRKEFEKVLKKYNVDLFLAGHLHNYLRTCNGLYRSKCNNGGPTHITVGTGGAPLFGGPLIPNSWKEKFLVDWGYGKVTVHNKTAIHWSFISDYGKSKGETLDEFWLKKD